MFSGCNFLLSPLLKNEQILIDAIESNNGKKVSRMSKSVTHYISTQEEYDTDPKVQSVPDHLHLVIPEFIHDSSKKKKIQKIEKYYVQKSPKHTRRKSSRQAENNQNALNQSADSLPASSKQPKGKKTTKQTSSSKSVAPLVTPVKRKPAKKAIPIPVDIGVSNPELYEVYIADQVTYDVLLNQTNIGHNNNKFYIMQILLEKSSGHVYDFKRWGRVGNHGQTSFNEMTDLRSAEISFKSKFKDKTGNSFDDLPKFISKPGKYDILQRDYFSDENEVEPKEKVAREEIPILDSVLDEKVQDLVRLICNLDMMKQSVVDIGYDAEKMPLGKLTKEHIKRSMSLLTDLSAEISKQVPNRDHLLHLSNRFYTLVPHNFGMRAPPIIDSIDRLKAKIEMVELLVDVEIATSLLKQTEEELGKNPIDIRYEKLNSDILPIEKSAEEYKLVKQYLQNTAGPTHDKYKLKLLEIFKVDRFGESERFDQFVDSAMRKNIKLLWHGSRLSNFVGILSQGLRIAPPEAPSTGYMFDKGVYFADIVTKSANYCFASSSNPVGILLLCEVATGDELEMTSADYEASSKVKTAKKHSTKGLGSIFPKDFVTDANGVQIPLGKPKTDKKISTDLQYNEYIVYNVEQIKIKYLLKVEFEFK